MRAIPSPTCSTEADLGQLGLDVVLLDPLAEDRADLVRA